LPYSCNASKHIAFDFFERVACQEIYLTKAKNIRFTKEKTGRYCHKKFFKNFHKFAFTQMANIDA